MLWQPWFIRMIKKYEATPCGLGLSDQLQPWLRC